MNEIQKAIYESLSNDTLIDIHTVDGESIRVDEFISTISPSLVRLAKSKGNAINSRKRFYLVNIDSITFIEEFNKLQ
ncbi:hypothetical protein PT274_01585 [Leuconostocaceae bacterium ESL0958]|nr:hypothetical protein [Leuconostocaceae bacterium ESL0958]